MLLDDGAILILMMRMLGDDDGFKTAAILMMRIATMMAMTMVDWDYHSDSGLLEPQVCDWTCFQSLKDIVTDL